MIYHPKTGVHYAHVVSSQWGPHVDIHAMWTKFSQIYPWISVHGPEKALSGLTDDFPLWEDPNVLVVIWIGGVPLVRNRYGRHAKTALVYAEAIGESNEMLSEHIEEFEKFTKACEATQYDCALVHTPWMKEQLLKHNIPSFVFPIGWDESIYGSPRFDGPKLYDYAYYGSSIGKRLLTVPFLQKHLCERFHDISGCFGKLLMAELDRSRASLYVAHSDVGSYSTWRIWQTLGTSACLVSEPGDCWPLDPTRHMVVIDRVDPTEPEETQESSQPAILETCIGKLLNILDEVDLLSIAKLTHEEVARKYTCEYCINEYLVPAGAAMCGR